MLRSRLSLTVIAFFVLTLAACSLFSRKNEQPQTQAERTPTPLDMPKEKQTEPPASGAVEPVPAPATDAASVAPNGETPAAEAPAAAATAKPSAEKTTWSYEGDRGPDHWADLSPEYAACRDGKSQSPVSLKWHKPAKGGAVAVSYKSVSGSVKDNGHTIEVSLEPGSQIRIDGKIFDLMAIHFHAPSEHTLSGKAFPMEAHFVHRDQSGNLAVLGVFFSKGKQNPTIAKIWGALNGSGAESHSSVTIDPQSLLPTVSSHYEYDGSLTTPPCTENVKWIVYNNPVHLAEAQIQAFQRLYGHNARPAQALHDRKLQNF